MLLTHKKLNKVGSGWGYFAGKANPPRDLCNKMLLSKIFRKFQVRKYIIIVALYRNQEDQDYFC